MEQMEETTLTQQEQSTRAGKYLTFALAEEEYGLEILKVREIISMSEITSVPKTPEYVKGVINLRGKVIPVIDLRLKFSMEEVPYTDETCTIVVDVNGVEMGIIVDHVSEVLDIADGDIEDAPEFGASVNIDFILGMGKAEGRVTILLDISKVISEDDLAAMKSTE
ncbi:MAG: chemotaxis protein CheW [Phycisphaerales bacterium]|jgi:purine-binding chemotaxis protein CheW|nr:chemotaxis protein CheW [Phycisphaerales bacterium]